MNGHRCAICNDTGTFRPSMTDTWVKCPMCKPSAPHESAGIAPARAPDSEPLFGGHVLSASAAKELEARVGLAAPVRGRQAPPLGVSQEDLDQVVAELGALDWRGGVLDPNAKRDPFTLTDDEPEQPSWQRRHDDIDPEKRAFWNGAAWGWAVGVVMTAAAVAWRDYGTLLP